MFATKLKASVLALVLVASVIGAGATAAAGSGTTSTQQGAYAGTHVSFDVTSTAVADYRVGDETVLESVKVQSQSEAQSSGGVGDDLSQVTDFTGAALSFDAESETSATVTTDSGAELRAHDNERGIMTVHAGENSQYVAVDLGASASAESESAQRVVVTNDDGSQGAFVVVGDGEVTVNDDGNVSAELEGDSQLVFRAYADERTDEDDRTEQLIAEGQAAAEVYVMQQADASGEAVIDVVQYSHDTTVEVTQEAEGEVRMTAEGTQDDGEVILASVSEAVVSSTDDIEVTVDGEAAAEASSYSELVGSIDSGDSSEFLLRQDSTVGGATDVILALDHRSDGDVLLRFGSDGNTLVDGDEFVGSHTLFGASSDAVVDYSVNGETVFESVTIQSTSAAESQAGIDVGVDLSAVTDFVGAALSFDSASETSATVTTDSGAELRAHDNERGIMVVHAGEDSQYVSVNLSAAAGAESESAQRVVVTNDDGSQGAFVVVGDGEVTVNDDGNVSAELEGDSQLVFRAYADERTDEDDRTEQLIAEGQAAAEVYVQQTSESGSETVVDVVQYSHDTTVDVTHQAEGEVQMTAERTEHEGKVIITSVSEAVISSTDDIEVTVDGEAAAEASSYSELVGAIDDGETSKFMVTQSASTEAHADVLVAVNHFSERQVTMAQAETAGAGPGDDTGDDSLPGFWIGVGAFAVLAVVLGIASLRGWVNGPRDS